jgi:regulator of protease activity HflC (stomatin/prohibitin superfamily)
MTTQQPHHQERPATSRDGYAMAGLGIVLLLATPVLAILVARSGAFALLALVPFTAAGGVLLLVGLYMLQPNEAANLTLFGRYSGTDRHDGLRWANPLMRKARLSLRSRNLNVAPLKVNDQRGNPVEIGAVVVWRVRDTAQAAFDVDDYEAYVTVQAEAALRHLASQYAYDEGDDLSTGQATLRGGMDVVSMALREELQARFDAAGVDVQDAKISHLAYAPEIAQVMLRRQQAEAIVSARHKIVQGAVSMVEAALNGLSERRIVELDDERRAAMVSNLLVVLCSDKDTQPIVNTGTLYG